MLQRIAPAMLTCVPSTRTGYASSALFLALTSARLRGKLLPGWSAHAPPAMLPGRSDTPITTTGQCLWVMGAIMQEGFVPREEFLPRPQKQELSWVINTSTPYQASMIRMMASRETNF